jgi:small conductance mechanosensitive channel
MDETAPPKNGADATNLIEEAKEVGKAASDQIQNIADIAWNNFITFQFNEMDAEQWTALGFYVGLKLAVVLVILFFAMTLSGWVTATVGASLKRMKFDPTLSKFLAKMAGWGVLVLAALSCLSYFGVETTSFAAVIGAAGLAIGLAFQGTLSNFAAGAMLLVFRPFKIGDVVNLDGTVGVVDEIELFTTEIDTFDNRRIILPNSQVFGSKIENISHHPVRRVEVDVGADYSADIDATRAALQQAIEATEGALSDPEPAVVLQGLGDSSVDWSVRVWARKEDFLSVKQSLIQSIKRSLDSANISIPYPRMDVHLEQPS